MWFQQKTHKQKLKGNLFSQLSFDSGLRRGDVCHKAALIVTVKLRNELFIYNIELAGSYVN